MHKMKYVGTSRMQFYYCVQIGCREHALTLKLIKYTFLLALRLAND